MRIFILSVLAVSLLSSCMKKEDTVNIPPEAKVMSGYEYPAMPLDQYNQMNSGTSVPAV